MLIELTDGNKEVVNQILPHIYDELRRLASSYLRRERSDHTLQPTALVHEAYMKLIDQKQVHWQNRAHFFGIAAQVMRRILMDHARKHTADKRGGDAEKLPIEEEILIVSHDKSADLIALDDALQNLAKFDEQKAKIVELRYFGGLSIEETAEVMGVSVPTINRQWRMAKAWLYSPRFAANLNTFHYNESISSFAGAVWVNAGQCRFDLVAHTGRRGLEIDSGPLSASRSIPNSSSPILFASDTPSE